jgi:hypothetical protein
LPSDAHVPPRRAFIAASGAAAFGGALAAAGRGESADQPAPPARAPALLEMRAYHFRFGPMESRFAEYAKGALVPALNRAGIKPVGAFTVLFGPDSPTVRLLLPHPTPESLVSLDGRLAADAEYRRAATAFLGLPSVDPPYVRFDSSLMVPFERSPAIEPPAGPAAAPSRVFELRTYSSPSEGGRAKKIEMFESMGEIPVFRRLAMAPVFFGRDIAGTGLPSLTYMLVFADMAAREKGWAAFRDDPEWVKLRSTPGYANADIMTGINVMLLRPSDYSQI